MKKIDEFNAQDRTDLKLFENSIHVLTGEICEENIAAAIKWILYENLESKDKIITLYINSTGGDLYSAFALIDIMKHSQHPIRTIGIGAVMSSAFLIFASGSKGQRMAATNTSFMCHQFSSGVEAKYHDLKAEMKETLLTQEWLEIRHAAKENPALQKSVDHLIMMYRLTKNGNSKT